jgi:16S rRNA G1207 methylase RsmC
MKSQRNQNSKINGSLKKMISNYKSINTSKSKTKIMSFQVCLKKLPKKKNTKFRNAIYVTLSTLCLETNVELITHLAPNLELTLDQQQG